MRVLTLIVLAVLVACEGPVGPEGPQGPQGVAGEKGDTGPAGRTPESVYLEAPLITSETYQGADSFYLASDRITQANFRGVFLKVRWAAGPVGFVPLEYLVSNYVSVVPEDFEITTPVVSVQQGRVVVYDPNQIVVRIINGAGDVFTPLAMAVLIAESQ